MQELVDWMDANGYRNKVARHEAELALEFAMEQYQLAKTAGNLELADKYFGMAQRLHALLQAGYFKLVKVVE